jgi:hypothetical protein
MTRYDDKKQPRPKAEQSHKPAKHIEETAKLASSVESDKNPEKVVKAGACAKRPG